MILEPQHIAGNGSSAMERDASAQQRVVRRSERRRRFGGDAPPGRVDPAQLVHVAQATAAVLDVRFQQKCDFAVVEMTGAGAPTLASRTRMRPSCAGLGMSARALAREASASLSLPAMNFITPSCVAAPPGARRSADSSGK